MKKYNKLIIISALLTPSISFAALEGLRGLIGDFSGILDSVIKVVFGLALAFFFWGGAQFILNDAANDKTREDGKKKMLWGVIALFIMFSIYGILSEISNLTGIQIPQQNLPANQIPPFNVPLPGGSGIQNP